MVKKNKYRVGYRDGISDSDPIEYVEFETYGEDQAIKEAAKSTVDPYFTTTIREIDELQGSAEEIKEQLLYMRIIITSIEKMQ